MGILRDSLSRILDNGERQALSLLNEAQRAIDNFDFDATVNTLRERGNTLYGSLNDLMKNIKDSVSDFKVIVPFNEKKEKFSYNVTGDVLTVTVTGKGTKSETKVTVPSNCIVDEMTHTINQKRRELIVSIPKDITKDENLVKAKEECWKRVNEASAKAKDSVGWLKDALKERAEAVAASTTAPTSKPRAKKSVSKAKPKVVRGANGRFVSTTTKKKATKKA